jgi:hypothetical protein
MEFGNRNILVGRFDNENSGSGNAFDPGLGLSGTGHPELFPTSLPRAYVVRPENVSGAAGHELTSLDFGILHVGDPASLSYVVTNYSGDAGYPSTGAIQTATHGGNVTDPALSGSGVTAQDFRIPGRGSFRTYDIDLDTSHAGVLHDQAVHIAYLFDRNNFNTGVTLPITGTILNYADPGFALDSGPGTPSHDGSSWTLDLGTIEQGSDLPPIALSVVNLAGTPADDLGGRFDLSGKGTTVTGADPFSGLAAGDSLSTLTLHVDTEALGALSTTITLHPFGSNASGFERMLPDVTLTITDRVVA